MKKALSLIVAIALICCALSFGTLAAETKTQVLFDTAESSGELAVTFRTGRAPVFGDSYSAVNTIYLRGDDVAYDFNNGFLTFRAILEQNSFYGYIPAFPFIHMQAENLPVGDFDLRESLKVLSDFTMEFLVFIESEEITEKGTTYYVEKFSDRGSVVNSFYYLGDELKVLKAQDFAKDTIQYTYFDEIAFEVEPEVFQKPSWSLELTAILKFILSLFA